ncbi:MAG: RNA polymerase sigma-70 factor [Cytophagales bacterium]|nr:RNA polymerase sigma-70 factor [Cytophagales bacterium]
MVEKGKYQLLLQKISKGDDEKALKELFDHFYGRLVEVAKFFVNDLFLAQDVVSEVFIKLWKNRAGLSSVENVNTYLYVAVKRQALNAIRDSKQKKMFSLEDQDAGIYIEAVNPEKQLLSKEFIDVLNSAIQDLPSKCRLIYSLVKDDDMKYKEVADTMDISIKTVEMHVGKALKRIKLAFEKYQE